MKAFPFSNRKQKGQTVLEYFMVLLAIVVPMAMWINQSVGGGENKKHTAQQITQSAFGKSDQLGIIGRPYP